MYDLARILFVEDDPDVFELIDLSLGAIGGFEVHGFLDGREAVRQASDLDPQLVLLDVMMPNMDGPSVMLALRKLEKYEHKPFVFLTAKVQDRDVARLRELGAVEVLSKPFDPMTLADEIRKVWDAHRQ